MKIGLFVMKLFLFFLLIQGHSLLATEARLEELQSLYVSKFSNYIEWPLTTHKSFKIGVYNNQQLRDELLKLFSNVALLNKPVEIVDLDSKMLDLSDFTIVIAQNIEVLQKKDFKNIISNGLLLVTMDEKGLIKGAILNFYLNIDGKLKFEIDNDQAVLMNLKINSRLLNLARSSR